MNNNEIMRNNNEDNENNQWKIEIMNNETMKMANEW